MRRWLRILYQPWKWLVFTPLLLISTACFGALAVVLCFFLPPRWPSYLCGASWARFNAWITPIWVRVTGRENIDPRQSYVIVSNHMSQYDIFLVYGWLGIDFKWIMKKELRKLPAIGISCEKLGHIFIDRSDRRAAIAAIQAAKKRITGGTSVLFFPEGTRSRTGEMLPFKKGAFRTALDLGLPILPLTIRGTRNILPPDSTDLFPGRAELIIHPPVDTAGYDDHNITDLIATVRGIIQNRLLEPQRRRV